MIDAEVVQFFVVEQSKYVGSARLKVTLRAIGTRKHFGRSYKAENYHVQRSGPRCHRRP